jgi:hypothetical protein
LGSLAVTGNITGGNVLGGANVNATTHTGTTVSVTGNITGGNVLGGANVNATTHTGTTVSVTSTVTGSQFNGSGAGLTSIPGANVTGTVPLATSATTAGTVTTAAQGNITSVGTLSSLSVTGNIISSGNVGMSAVPGTNTNAALPVLFQTSAGIIDGGSGLTYNPAGDQLSVNGMTISSGTVSGAGSLATFTSANGAGQYDFRAANDSLRLIAGSSEAMRIISSGFVGIGVAAPLAKLDVLLTGTANIATTAITKVTDFAASSSFGFPGLANNNDGAYFGMGAGGTNGIPAGLGFMREAAGWQTAIAFYTNNVTGGPNSTNAIQEKVRITSDGLVGIGTSSPGYKLVIKQASGDLQFAMQGAVKNWNFRNQADGTFGYYDDSLGYWRYYYDTSNNHIWFNGASVERMRLDSGGNMGIGTAVNTVFDAVADLRPLVVQKSDASTTLNGSTAAITISNGNTTTNNTAQLNFAAITGANTNHYSSAIISAIFGARTNGQYPTGQLVFSTSTSLNTAPTEKMRITSAGLVGIGTSTPSEQLTLASGYVQTGNGIGGAGGVLFPYGGDAGTRTWRVRTDHAAYGDWGVEQSTTQTGTTFATKFLINPSGLVAINTATPNASAQTTIKQGSSAYQLQLEQSNATDGYGLRCDAANGDLTFSRYATGAYTERVKFTLDGNIQLSTAGTKILNSSGKPILQQTGSVLQVVSATLNTYGSTGSSTYVLVGGLSVAITPASTTNKVLIRGYIWLAGSTQNGVFAAVFRDGSILAGVAGSGAQPNAVENGGSGTVVASGGFIPASGYVTYQATPICFEFLDSPARTSSATYQIGIRVGGGGVVYYNYQSNTGTNPDFGYFASTITAMEIVA